MSLAQPFRRTLLPGAIVCLIAIGLFSSSINLKREGESGRDQRNGSVSSWHFRSPTELREDSVQNAVLAGFQCDDHLLLCHCSSGEPYDP